MKKVLSILLMSILAVLLTGGYLVFDRYRRNPDQVFPYPYEFASAAAPVKSEAPILLVGDRMGEYFYKYKDELAQVISKNLEEPIEIESLAKAGHGIHRTLHELASLETWPQVLIYHGASEEFRENKFNSSEMGLVRQNFGTYNDERIHTMLMLWPKLSRLVYQPLKRISLPEAPVEAEALSETDYFKRLETELLLFEQQLVQLVTRARDKRTLLILTTTPLNLDITPKKVCEFATSDEIERSVYEIRELLKARDPKGAYSKSQALIKDYSGNALVYFIHGQVAKRLGYTEEALTHLQNATAYDCEPWRASEVFNAIIRKVARAHQVLLFDFARLVEKDWNANETFFDELHPQNLYYERGMTQLGLVIKEILKL